MYVPPAYRPVNRVYMRAHFSNTDSLCAETNTDYSEIRTNESKQNLQGGGLGEGGGADSAQPCKQIGLDSQTG